MRRVLRVALAAMLAAAGTSAEAAWYQASSKHFVIYANESPKELSDFASKLERFDQVVRFVRSMSDPDIGSGNRLTVFVLPSVDSVQKLMNGDRFVDGFYVGRASGSLAFVPRNLNSAQSGGLDTNIIFFHEYSHHLMFQIVDKPLPEWVVEGFAEFMSTVQFEKNGMIQIGFPDNIRAAGLFRGEKLPLATMLSANYSKLSDEQRESVYGRGWLLVHYLTFTKSRSGQIDRYVELMAKGIPPLDAAREAFGDLKQLDRDLDTYLMRNRFLSLNLPGDRFQPGRIEIQPLSEGASKVILLRAQSKYGVNQKTAEPLAKEVREIEARYRGDELVELTLAEAEIDTGHFEASEAAAERALKANPNDTKAMILKGRATLERAIRMNGDGRQKAFDLARQIFIGANKIDTEDPEPLIYFYQSYVAEGMRPNDNAVAALHYAAELAPQDGPLRMNSALQYLRDDKPADAKRLLTVLAYDPHGAALSQVARAMILKIDAGDMKSALVAGNSDKISEATGASH